MIIGVAMYMYMAVLFLQSVSDNKRKMSEAKRRWEEEVEEMKTAHEAEMAGLREKMRKEKNVASTSTSEQLAQLERELEEQWKSRAERQVSTVEERWRRKLDEAREEQRSLQDQLREANMKVRGPPCDMYTPQNEVIVVCSGGDSTSSGQQ